LINKTDQTTGDSSTAYLANRDINVKGMDYNNVRQVCFDLFDANFPKLLEQAMQQVNANVTALADELEKEIEKRKESIDVEKLSEPDVQAALNDAIQGAAKKGKKADLNLLSKLVTSRLDKENSDLLDITIEEAVRLVPKLTKQHINFLSVKHFITDINIGEPNITFNRLEQYAAVVLNSFGNDCVISKGNIQYLAGLGLLDFNLSFYNDPYKAQYNCYTELSENLEKFKEQVEGGAPSLYRLIKIYDENKYGSSVLNTFGKVIALTNLGRALVGIDLKIWIK
jgi:hypothetical protein